MGSEGAGLGEETGNFVLGVSPVRCLSHRSSGADESMASRKVIIYSSSFAKGNILCQYNCFLFYTYECSKVRYWHIWLLQISGFIAYMPMNQCR